MPVFINEVSAEVTEPVVPQTQSEAVEQQSPVSQPEQEFLAMLNIIDERRQRLTFD